MISDSDFSHFIDGQTECQKFCLLSCQHIEDETDLEQRVITKSFQFQPTKAAYQFSVN
jgi:hypothetical protein